MWLVAEDFTVDVELLSVRGSWRYAQEMPAQARVNGLRRLALVVDAEDEVISILVRVRRITARASLPEGTEVKDY